MSNRGRDSHHHHAPHPNHNQQQHNPVQPLHPQDETRASKGLDHFKRGYQERASTRDREFYSQQRTKRLDRSGNINDNHNNNSDPWANRDRVTIVFGLDCNQLLDEMLKTRDRRTVFDILDKARQQYAQGFECGKAITALISASARRRHTQLAYTIWDWVLAVKIPLNVFHYNAMIAVAATERAPEKALGLMDEMTRFKIPKNEVTFSSAITACEKKGDWRTAMDLLDGMEREGFPRTAIAYNAAISACEKGMVPAKACEVFNRMKREGIVPSVVTYSALISAAEKGGQWRLAMDILEDMKRDGHRGNVIAYSAAISALAKGQQSELALQLFREIQSCGREPSIVTYNATMTALEKGLEWEKALELFDEMKTRNLHVTVVSYGSAISACDKGLQYRQALEFLDEMTEMGIQKNVIIFGAALSCMEKCCRADICFLLMERMRQEKLAPNVHIFNSAISACARSNLWEKGYELFKEMEAANVARDVVSYNAVLDAVQTQIRLGRTLFREGVDKGFYARVSRITNQWFELDVHFMSLGGGEIAVGWWFEERLVEFMEDLEKLRDVKSISIVTGYGKTRTRGRRLGDDGMRKRVKAMLTFMDIKEQEQPNLGRIHIDMEAFIATIKKNGGRIVFDLHGYVGWKEAETTTNSVPDVEQKIRPRYRPINAGSNGPPFERIETDQTSPEYRLENMKGLGVQAPDGRAADNMDRRANDSRGGPPQGRDVDYTRRNGDRDGPRGDSRGGAPRHRGFDDRSRGEGGAREDRRSNDNFRDGPRGNERDGREPNRQNGGYDSGRGDFRENRPTRGGLGGARNSHDNAGPRDDQYNRDDRFRDNGSDGRGRADGRYENGRDNSRVDGRDSGRYNDDAQGRSNGSRNYDARFNDQSGRVSRENSQGGDNVQRKRGYQDVEASQPQTRGYDLEPNRQKRLA